jgi:regulator of sigma E protease
MSERKGLLSKYYFRIFLLVAAFAAAVYLIIQNMAVFGNILLVALGFGGVVIVHEFGHFIVAKLSGIKVEAFSIFMPPTLLGVQRTEGGMRFRLLPALFPAEGDESAEGGLIFTVGKGGRAGETEYRFGLIPFGGFVKMLGQDDAGPAKTTDDPRSYANKPVGIRMAVIAAGVLFNAISALMIFVIVFLIGIKLPPAVVGGVVPDSPAAKAGLKPGDEIIEIDGKTKDLDYSNILVAAALSGKGEKISMKVKRGQEILDFEMASEEREGSDIRLFGIQKPTTLTVEDISEADANRLRERTGLLAGDVMRAVNGRDVNGYWELVDMVRHSLGPSVELLAERTRGPEKGKLVKTQVGLGWRFAGTYEIESESELYQVCSMVPRLRIAGVKSKPASRWDWFKSLVGRGGRAGQGAADDAPKVGDIIVSVARVENPTYKELREAAEAHEGKELALKVVRVDGNGVEKVIPLTVQPELRADVNWVELGIGLMLDTKHPVVAKTIETESGPPALEIPRGAMITAVDGTAVSDFYDVVREFKAQSGKPMQIDYRLDDGKAGQATLDVGDTKGLITVNSMFAESIPLKDLKRLYKADNPVEAIAMGYRKTIMFIAQTYVTLRRLIGGLVSPKSLMGPVGILAVSYTIVTDQPLINYAYLLGLISACIAVVNFLPLPPFDGGHIVLLGIEKVKGSALSERVQGAVAYAGVVFVIALFLYLTFNDVLNMFLR